MNGVLAVSRAIGDIDFKKWVIATPNVCSVELKDGFYLLFLIFKSRFAFIFVVFSYFHLSF